MGLPAMTLPAPAKLNLYLGVYDQLDTRGYHRVDSLMIALDLADTVHITPAQELEVRCKPAVSFPQEKNTAYKAALAMAKLAHKDTHFCITIEKHIPEQSGMGGSSADAAAVIRALCSYWGYAPTSPEVLAAAATVGADVPFYLHPVPTLLEGAGDVPKETFPALDDVPVVLIRPVGPGVSTVEAYKEFDRIHEPAAAVEPLCEALRAQDVAGVAASLANNLDPVACRLLPEVAVVKEWLMARAGVISGQVTGSGSCVFAICETYAAAAQIAADAWAFGAGRPCGGWWAMCATTSSALAVPQEA